MREVAVVIPTYNERSNITVLVDRLSHSLAGVDYEIVFVDDDSPDDTAGLVRSVAQANPLVRLIHRIGRRGLASACMEGMLSTATPYVCVMDADLQHDDAVLPEMLRLMRTGSYDIVVGSRNVTGGSMGSFAKSRIRLSMLGKRVSTWISGVHIEDPMSGFFLLTRETLLGCAHQVSGIGFKILLDILASTNPKPRVIEVPYTFRRRYSGESKLDLLVGIEYLQLVLDKSIGGSIPSAFVMFSLVGSLGVVLYSAALWIMLAVAGETFGRSQLVAALLAMTFNFTLNNVVTYRDRRLRGWRFAQGLIVFYAACSIGLFINLRIAEIAFHSGVHWLVAGLIGLVIGSVWNFGVTNVFAWNVSRSNRGVRRAAA